MVYNIMCEAVYAVGDIHGSFETLLYEIRRKDLSNCLIICCGDVGFGFEKEHYYELLTEKFEKECSDRSCYVLMFRGNHDDPSYFDGKRIASEHFIAIPDYSVVNICRTDGNVTKRILCIGGAISVDRSKRIEIWEDKVKAYAWHCGRSLEDAKRDFGKHLYWENEPVVYDESELERLKDNGLMIDVVCTHTCPSFCKPVTKDGLEGWLKEDPYLEDDINREREDMDRIHSKLKSDGHPLKKWVYGHFHKHNNEIIEGVEYIMLDMFRYENNKFDMIEI